MSNKKIIDNLEIEDFVEKEEKDFLEEKKYAIKKGWNYTRFKNNRSLNKFLGKKASETRMVREYKMFCTYISVFKDKTMRGYIDFMNVGQTQAEHKRLSASNS